jgi:hypothetical protein
VLAAHKVRLILVALGGVVEMDQILCFQQLPQQVAAVVVVKRNKELTAALGVVMVILLLLLVVAPAQRVKVSLVELFQAVLVERAVAVAAAQVQ